MAAYTHYPTAQPAYSFETPPPGGQHYYNHPRYAVNTATPSPRGSPKTSSHTRRASYAPAGYMSASRVPAQFFAEQQASPSPRYPSYQSTPLRNPENTRPKRAPDGMYGKTHRDKTQRPRSSHWHYVFVNDDYETYDAPPPYTTTYEYEPYAGADHRYSYDQAPQYQPKPESTPLKANQARQRRASTATRPHASPPKKPTPKATPSKPIRKATDEDARRAGIPAGYSYKNWDPTEEPITLLGSVFDSNSLGKWIYDWTVFYYGPATPMSDVAGDLWLLLIQLSGKVKRADECIEKIRQEESRELVEDFLESGERLWIRFKKLLKICEEYMWKAAKMENGDKKPAAMGKNSGCEFVDSIFGRDRELDKTEKLMSAVRLWSMRFDANCDEILRNPTA
ncbi:hypothetical protein EJ08DRAFT_662446 [Tothia fuscella]|uniref:Vegetative cell wall protein gp1 n=1 Tax=Tothia fuscella TaxID=1048955 RepID=A0A9P4NNK6_9PEZI|nr:hypothetical protein EJ08DRAFT_662446 [Tothia fuscella]